MSYSIQPERTSQRAINKLTLSLSFSTVHLWEKPTIKYWYSMIVWVEKCSDLRFPTAFSAGMREIAPDVALKK